MEAQRSRRRFGALLVTYSCTVACEHCCFDCSPRKATPVISVEQGVRYLAQLHALDRSIHIAGGEPFFYYDRLREIVHAAHRAGVAPHFIETNGSWCDTDERVRERFADLRANGVLWMLISTDPYHLRLIPVERVARGLRIAEEVFGRDTTMGLATVEELESRAALGKDEAVWRQYVKEHPPQFVGRAAPSFACLPEPKPLSELGLETGWGIDPLNTCNAQWDPLWEIHVDAYGNVQTNCGILLGNADEVPVPELMTTWHVRNPLLGEFSQRGVAALVDWACEFDFPFQPAYTQKCFLCFALRAFLRQRDERFRSMFGPDEIYEEAPAV